MGLVILAALCVAGFAILFRFFERFQVPLVPAIAINYNVAFVCGLLVAPPWKAEGTKDLLLPAALLGSFFVMLFSLQGISAQRAGAARTTIAGRMSLVLTIAGTVFFFQETLSTTALIAIALALVGLVLTSITATAERTESSWMLPFLIFLGCGAADIGITYIQRVLTTSANASTFPTLCFGASAVVSAGLLLVRGEHNALRHLRTWIGGVVLGVVNYASLLFLVQALDVGSLAASVIFPTMNIFAILFATATALLLFRERLSVRQWVGIVLCVSALILIMSGT